MYKDKHHSVSILLFFYINCLLIPVYVESSDTLSVVIIPFMKMENNPKYQLLQYTSPSLC